MGLDTVELVIRVEEAFGIFIPDERAAKMRTVGDLHQFLVEELGQQYGRKRVCLSAVTFYAVRRALSARLGVSRRIHPKDRVDQVLPWPRRSAWQRLEDELGLELPGLSRPTWLVRSCGVLLILLGVWLGLMVYGSQGLWLAVAAFLVWMPLGGITAATLTIPFATVPGPAIATVGAVSHQVLARNHARLSKRYGPSNSSDVWRSLGVIVVDQLGVKPEEVTKDARFVEDLGAD